MKTTIELPDELYRRVKAEAALRGRKVKDMVQEGLHLVLEKKEPASRRRGKPSPSVYDLVKDAVGIFDSGVPDLATNPKYMEDFGRDASDR